MRYLVEESLKKLSPIENLGISEANLRILLERLLILSLKKEEGRYPHFFVYVPSKAEHENPLVPSMLPFETGLQADLDNLHRLSSAIPKKPFALVVNPLLLMVGIGLLPGSPSSLRNRAYGLVIHILSPGYLVLSFQGKNIEIREGAVRDFFYLNEDPVYKAAILHIAGMYTLNPNEQPFFVTDDKKGASHGISIPVVSRGCVDGGVFFQTPLAQRQVGGYPSCCWFLCCLILFLQQGEPTNGVPARRTSRPSGRLPPPLVSQAPKKSPLW